MQRLIARSTDRRRRTLDTLGVALKIFFVVGCLPRCPLVMVWVVVAVTRFALGYTAGSSGDIPASETPFGPIAEQRSVPLQI
jgi:hypothetical protein